MSVECVTYFPVQNLFSETCLIWRMCYKILSKNIWRVIELTTCMDAFFFLHFFFSLCSAAVYFSWSCPIILHATRKKKIISAYNNPISKTFTSHDLSKPRTIPGANAKCTERQENKQGWMSYSWFNCICQKYNKGMEKLHKRHKILQKLSIRAVVSYYHDRAC